MYAPPPPPPCKMLPEGYTHDKVSEIFQCPVRVVEDFDVTECYTGMNKLAEVRQCTQTHESDKGNILRSASSPRKVSLFSCKKANV